MKKAQEKETGVKAEVINLANTLEEDSPLDTITNEDLIMLEKYLSESIPKLIRSAKYVIARKYQKLDEIVKIEIDSRNPYLLPRINTRQCFTHKKLDEFDKETALKIRVIEERAEKMDKEVFNVWESQLKARYFIPSPYIAEMRLKARRLEDRGDVPAADKLNEEADALAKEDKQQMEDAYNKDLENARREVRVKCNAEIQKLKKQRLRQRQQLEEELKKKKPKDESKL